MSIQDYQFGRIRIDGHEYTSDVIIYPEGVDDHWWRHEGHCLEAGDLSDVLNDPPRVLVIGTGFHGHMSVPKEILKSLMDKGVETHVAPTGEAVDDFNRLCREVPRVVAALHLTC